MESKELSVLENLPKLAEKLKVSIAIDAQELSAEVNEQTSNHQSRMLAAKSLKIEGQEDYDAAANLRNDFAKRESALTKIWKRLKDPLNEVRSQVLNLEKMTAAKEEAGKKLVTQKMEQYILDQRRAKAEVEARMAKVVTNQRSQLVEEAQDLMAQGFVDEANQKLQQANMTVAPTLPDAVEKTANTRVGDKWKGEVVDIVAVLTAIVQGKVPLMHEVGGQQRPLVIVDQVVVNALVARQQNALDIPGIVVKEGVRIGANRL